MGHDCRYCPALEMVETCGDGTLLARETWPVFGGQACHADGVSFRNIAVDDARDLIWRLVLPELQKPDKKWPCGTAVQGGLNRNP